MEKNSERHLYIDNLRLLMMIFVVMVHIAVTYSGFGSWYYKEVTELDIFSSVVFGYLMSYTQGYFMGFLFLIAGFFTPGAYDRKGFVTFLKDRFVRLGIPALIFMLAIHPLTDYYIVRSNWHTSIIDFFNYYLPYLQSFYFLNRSGPLWFAVALLIFCFTYAAVRLLSGPVKDKTQPKEVKTNGIVLLILLIALGAFGIRLVQPIDTSIMNMQLCYFSQYIILFITGIYAYRNNWLSTIHNWLGKRWLLITFAGGFIVWIIIMIGGGALEGLFPYKGGLNWQSAAFALWESFVSVSMSIGLITLFRQKYNRQSSLVKKLSDNAFAVFVFHTPILLSLSLLLKGIVLPPLLKFILLSVITLPVCFVVAHYVVRRIPVLKKVM